MQAKPPLKIVLCSPRGFCAGVVRAIDTVERALTIYGAPVYVRHEIVHNRYVVDSLRAKGAIFVSNFCAPAWIASLKKPGINLEALDHFRMQVARELDLPGPVGLDKDAARINSLAGATSEPNTTK